MVHAQAALAKQEKISDVIIGHFLVTANFLMVVIPAVLAHDVSARAGDVSMGIAVFPIGWIY